MTLTEVEYEDFVLTSFEKNAMRELERENERLQQALDLSRSEVRHLRESTAGRPTRSVSKQRAKQHEDAIRRAEAAEKTAEFSLGRCKVLSRDLREARKEVDRLKRLVRDLGGDP